MALLLAKHVLCETNRVVARVLVFSMRRVRMMTRSFGRCSTHSWAVALELQRTLVKSRALRHLDRFKRMRMSEQASSHWTRTLHV